MCDAQAELGRDRAAVWTTPRRSPDAGLKAPRARVLLEIPNGADAWTLWRLLAEAGYAAAWCPGPDRSRDRCCPLVTEGCCPLMDDADVVISALGPPVEPWRAVLKSQGLHYPGKPVVVGASAGDAVRLGPLPIGCRSLHAPLSGGPVLRVLESALAAAVASKPAGNASLGWNSTLV